MAILPTRATLLSTHIGELLEWHLLVVCRCRGFPRCLEIEALVEVFGTRPLLEAVLTRLRCERCSQGPIRVEAKRGDPFAVRTLAVVLLESKASVGRNRG